MKDDKRSPAVMGILNVTPNSFYDGGKFDEGDKAVKRALEMIEEGAEIIDIGGESTGPGAIEVSTEEELRRVIPVVSGITYQVLGIQVSVDTYKAEVARQALEAGATMINDVTAGRGDPKMFEVIAKASCPYVMMHSAHTTAHAQKENIQYDDVMKIITEFFSKRIDAATRAGITRGNIIIDPGLGHFVSSDPTYSWEILERLMELKVLGCPILVSPSRKSFTADAPDQPPSERLRGTLRATEIAVRNGVDIIRTHDVQATIDFLHS